MPGLHRAYIGIGANLGDPQETVLRASRRLRALGRAALSSLYRSAPVDAAGPWYVNAVAALDTPLSPQALLAALQDLEAGFGRTRSERNAPRTLDLDLLAHGDLVVVSPELRLPHPRLHLRAFVLLPLLELAPAIELPGLGPLLPYLEATRHQPVERIGPPPRMTH